MAEGETGDKITRWVKAHKGVAIGGGLGVLGIAGYAILKSRSSSSSSQAASSYLTPDSLVSSGTGGLITLGGTEGGGEVLIPPGGVGGTGASQTAASPTPTPTATGAALLGFSNPNTPVTLVGGSLIDTGTGRVAYYGPNGQPGSASQFAGSTSWTDPTGKTVYYNSNGYNYSDTTRAPDLPPATVGAG